ncbi:uncharacterized protein LOC126839886 isoform X2 [Adelges cooleyi]|uniref:uncharacterized protein LOC126839886 isoform X2 n=1 Tax=Adelges cooleyi TaxID=133065 RepID=UPI00217F5279|nr:uncharacterized protein LOC126839886 isoform X2 [Adelges cooleyi]
MKHPRESLEEYKNLITNENTSCENFVVTMTSKFKHVFWYENEVLEVLKIVGHDEKLPIPSTTYHEILKMLPASLRMALIFWDYNLSYGRSDDGLHVHGFLHYIRIHWRFREIPGSLRFRLQNRLKCVMM